MKTIIKIVKCSQRDYWYSKHIDQIFTVEPSGYPNKYKVCEVWQNVIYLIDIEDTEIVFEKKVFFVGQKVTYQKFTSEIREEFVNGIVKEVSDENNTRVVYYCNNDWENYQNYTGALTPNKMLQNGWV